MRLILYAAIALLLTLIIELPIACLFGKKLLLPVLLGNLLTNPAMNVILMAALAFSGTARYYALLPALEICAFIAEGLLLGTFISELTHKKALLISLLLNSVSFVFGFIMSCAL